MSDRNLRIKLPELPGRGTGLIDVPFLAEELTKTKEVNDSSFSTNPGK